MNYKFLSKLSIFCLVLIIGAVSGLIGCTNPTRPTKAPTLMSPTTPVANPAIEGTVTPTKIPLSLTGPWLVFANAGRLYALNQDGTGLKPLAPELHSVVNIQSSPSSNLIAVTSEPDEFESRTIIIVELPGGKVIREIPLLSFYTNKQTSLDHGPTGPVAEIESRVQWSPDGQYVAFMGAIETPLSSLYIYDSKLQTVRKFSQNRYQAADPIWSPDGRWIVYKEVSNAHNCITEGIWAASVSDGKIKRLYSPGIEQRILGWVGKDNFLVADRGLDGERNIRIVDVTTGNVESLYSGYYLTAAVDKNGTVAFFAGDGGPTQETTLYLTSPDTPDPILIRKPEYPFNPDLTWNSAAELFISAIQCDNEPEKIIAFDPTGRTTCVTKPKPNRSPNGAWYIAGNGQPGVYNSAGETLGELTGSIKRIIWNLNSDGFFIVTNDELHYVSLPGMNSQIIYKSKHKYYNFIWVGIP